MKIILLADCALPIHFGVGQVLCLVQVVDMECSCWKCGFHADIRGAGFWIPLKRETLVSTQELLCNPLFEKFLTNNSVFVEKKKVRYFWKGDTESFPSSCWSSKNNTNFIEVILWFLFQRKTFLMVLSFFFCACYRYSNRKKNCLVCETIEAFAFCAQLFTVKWKEKQQLLCRWGYIFWRILLIWRTAVGRVWGFLKTRDWRLLA